jgi:LysR family transcriptional regulator for bpeEF and oprC
MDAVPGRGMARLTGTIRIGIGTVITQHLVMPRLAEFLRQYPGLAVECRQRWHVKDMHAEGMDVLTWVGGQPDPNVIAHKLCQLRFDLYGSPAYLKTFGVPVHPRDLARHRCMVFYPVSWTTKPLDTWEFQRGKEREVVTVNSTLLCDEREMLITAAVNGVGLIRTGLFDPSLIATGRLRRVMSDWNSLGAPSLYVMYRKSQRQSPKIQAFLNFMREAVTAFDPEGLTVIHNTAAQAARRGA